MNIQQVIARLKDRMGKARWGLRLGWQVLIVLQKISGHMNVFGFVCISMYIYCCVLEASQTEKSGFTTYVC
ncbi:hypothetical protein L208DRAFT_758667 [Tricholoma matsutake]|nr:hypothetical protein L208DRAFT_758667 [Tricholoma matsutake 945]